MMSLSPTFVVLALGLVAGIDAQAASNGPMVNSPASLVQCQPAAITWSNARPPVYLSAVPGSNTAGNALVRFAPQNSASGSLTWPQVNITSGTTITLVINDGTGVNNFSGQVTILPGANDCNPISAAAGSGGSSSSAAGTTSAPSSTTAAAGGSTPASSSSRTTSPASTTSASSGSTTSGTLGLGATTNSVLVGAAAAAAAGVLLASGLF